MKSNTLLKTFLGLIFLSAGIFRIFNWETAILEITNLKLPFPAIISLAVVILEIIGGLFLIFNIQTKKTALTLSSFLFLALLWTFLNFSEGLISGSKLLFSFRADPTDFFLHITYLVILVSLVFKIDKK